ncbi:Hypp1679 [Branchiostoma lanceolatum]|uniref:Hypp1679 protein n=1 Tax=Branchiostoma lanceolatum TaxID=7740 RepID=A0A8K0EP97_BRALA|nr:Hypp1679 [Branchiostoma lanceolatum]
MYRRVARSELLRDDSWRPLCYTAPIISANEAHKPPRLRKDVSNCQPSDHVRGWHVAFSVRAAGEMHTAPVIRAANEASERHGRMDERSGGEQQAVRSDADSAAGSHDARVRSCS